MTFCLKVHCINTIFLYRTILLFIVMFIVNTILRNELLNLIKILFSMDPNPFLRHSFWTVSVGTTFSWLTVLSINPGAVQRYVALPSYKKARSALIYFIVGIAVVKTLTGAMGMLIYTKYKDCDPVSAQVSDAYLFYIKG